MAQLGLRVRAEDAHVLGERAVACELLVRRLRQQRWHEDALMDQRSESVQRSRERQGREWPWRVRYKVGVGWGHARENLADRVAHVVKLVLGQLVLALELHHTLGDVHGRGEAVWPRLERALRVVEDGLLCDHAMDALLVK